MRVLPARVERGRFDLDQQPVFQHWGLAKGGGHFIPRSVAQVTQRTSVRSKSTGRLPIPLPIEPDRSRPLVRGHYLWAVRAGWFMPLIWRQAAPDGNFKRLQRCATASR